MASLKDIHIDMDGMDRVWQRQCGHWQNRHRRRLQKKAVEAANEGNEPPPASALKGQSPMELNLLKRRQIRSRLPRSSEGDSPEPVFEKEANFLPISTPFSFGRLPPASPVKPLLVKPIKKQLPVGARSERLSIDGDIISYNSDKRIDGRVGAYIAGDPLTPAACYFEVEIRSMGSKGAIGIGLAPKAYPLDRQPGWNQDSVAFHADDGKLFKCNGQGRSFGVKCKSGDRIGCGIKFDQVVIDTEDSEDCRFDAGLAVRRKSPEASRILPSKRTPTVVPVFFTQNGCEIGRVFMAMPVGGLHPAVGMHSEGEQVRVLLGAPWIGDDGKMVVDLELEEEWSRLHDMRINGCVEGGLLEYTGKGKTISDVGLAIARNSLDTSNHYFEVTIIDPGENCYIAVGLVRKNYPKKRHPGWNKGSIAYHADDGKLFTGSGAGTAFGPRCKKGDTMGCGILFPPDFSPDGDADDEADEWDASTSDDELTDTDTGPFGRRGPPELKREKKPPLDLNELFESVSESDSDGVKGGAIGGAPCRRRGLRKREEGEEGGRRIAIFFTRNGQLVGRRDSFIPLGGFFPCIGMLSADEKVRVDLHPLTG